MCRNPTPCLVFAIGNRTPTVTLIVKRCSTAPQPLQGYTDSEIKRKKRKDHVTILTCLLSQITFFILFRFFIYNLQKNYIHNKTYKISIIIFIMWFQVKTDRRMCVCRKCSQEKQKYNLLVICACESARHTACHRTSCIIKDILQNIRNYFITNFQTK